MDIKEKSPTEQGKELNNNNKGTKKPLNTEIFNDFDAEKMFSEPEPESEPKSEQFNNKKTSFLDKLLNTQKELRNRKAQNIEFSKAFLFQNENPVIFPNTINVIQGQAGCHKSRLAENFAACLISNSKSNEALNLTSDIDLNLCYVDTERNLKDQLPFALQNIQVKAGFTIYDHPANFDYISLLEIERTFRFEALNDYISYVQKKSNSHVFIILDVATDCITDFNQVKDSMLLIDLMNVMINHFNVTFLCIVHENPGDSQKARGHFGTEVRNKASTVMAVGFEKDSEQNDTDIIRVKYLKCRATKKHEPFYMKYSDEAKGLVLATDAEISEIINKRKHKADETDIIDYLETYLGDSELKNADLLDKLCKDFKASAKTITGRLKSIIENESDITNSKGENCQLRKKSFQKEVIYYLEPTPEIKNYYESNDL